MNRSAVEDIKARLPIEEVVGQYVKLEKAGKSYKARCPFHNEKSASFFVSPDRGGYYCFGCGAKGDIFSFVEQFEGLDFRGALKILAEKAGVPLVYDQKADSERDRLLEVMEVATIYFQNELGKHKDANEYIKKRGIADATRGEFRIGLAPLGWSNLHTHLKGKGYQDMLIEKAGLIKAKDTTDASSQISNLGSPISVRYYDRFRGRIMFPIADSSGRIIAFSGRILVDDGKSAKYLNSPDTPLYDKSAVLYGLDRAKGEIRRLGYTIMVEGQMDLVMSHQAGIKNAVAASGTALADTASNREGVINNLGLIRRLSPNVIIGFDSDAAGRKAAMRAAGIALSLGMDVKIADIEGGKDPADLVLADPEAWKATLRGAKPIVEFELGNVLREETDPRKVPRLLRDRVLPFVAVLESATDKAYAIKQISDATGLADTALWDDLHVVEKKVRESMNSSAQNLKPDSPAGELNKPEIPNPKSKTLVPNAAHHLDLVERRMFGLLALMEAAKTNTSSTVTYLQEIQTISGGTYHMRNERVKPILGDITFEAEAFYGTDPTKWDVHMRELIQNFETDVINQELVSTMTELRLAEKAGKKELVEELAKKCQALSIRKAEVGKIKK